MSYFETSVFSDSGIDDSLMNLVQQSIKILEERQKSELAKITRMQAESKHKVAGPDDLSDSAYKVKGDKESPDASRILANSIIISRMSQKASKKLSTGSTRDNTGSGLMEGGPVYQELNQSKASLKSQRSSR